MPSSTANRRTGRRWLPVLLSLLLVLGAAACARVVAGPQPAHPPAAQGRTYALPAAPSQFLLAGESVLLTTAAGQGIDRLDLATGQTSPVLTRHFYPDGAVDSYRLGLAGDWLIYLEISRGNNGRSWTLAAHNLASGQTVAIDQAQDDEVSWPGPEVAADGDWVVWVRNESRDGGPRSLIHARNLRSGEQKTLASELDATRESWAWPNLRGELLVVERDRTGDQGLASDVYRVDLGSGQATPLSATGRASEPATDGRYVAWKAAPRFARGALAIYDLASQAGQTVDLAVEYPHLGDGRVVAWAEGTGLVQVEAASGRYTPLAGSGQAGSSQAGEVSLAGGRVAWLEAGEGTPGQPRATLHVQEE